MVRLGTGLVGQERLGAGLVGQERLGTGLTGQERLGRGLVGQERLKAGLVGQERLGTGLTGQERLGRGLVGQERLETGRCLFTDLGGACTVVDLPPSFDEVVRCVLRGVGPRVEDDCVHLWEVAMLPRFDGTDEVDYLRISPESEGEREQLRKG